jgi:aminoglycoside phosphotransferase (APT) family kinase protein
MQLAREARLLPQLAERLPVAVPNSEYVCPDPAGGMRFVGNRAIGGTPVVESRLAEERDPAYAESLARELGAVLDALHSFPVVEAHRIGVLGGSAEDWRREYAAFYAEIRDGVFPLLNAHERGWVQALWDGYLEDAESFAFEPTLIHHDLAIEHILHDPASGRLTGIIDWGDAWIDDPAIDFSGLRRGLGDAFARRGALRAPDRRGLLAAHPLLR